MPGPSGKTVSSPISPTFSLSGLSSPSISSPASFVSIRDSPLVRFPRSPVPQKRIKLSSAARSLTSSYTQPYVPPSSKEISKIFCICTRIENKVDRLTEIIIENSKQDGGNFDRLDGDIMTIHDEVNLETSLSEKSSVSGISDNNQVRMIQDNILQLRNQSSSATSFAVKLVRQMFEPHELVGRNVSGVRGKKPLDGSKIGQIKKTVNQFYPVPTAEALETWKNCRKAIDSFLRKTHSASTSTATNNS